VLILLAAAVTRVTTHFCNPSPQSLLPNNPHSFSAGLMSAAAAATAHSTIFASKARAQGCGMVAVGSQGMVYSTWRGTFSFSATLTYMSAKGGHMWLSGSVQKLAGCGSQQCRKCG
jgi:hypothetical protein